jgi:hypothetical protein
MEKKILVSCECKGTGFIAVADNGGDGVEHVECGQHHPAFKANTGSLIGNIMEAAKEIERLTSHTDLSLPVTIQAEVRPEVVRRDVQM